MPLLTTWQLVKMTGPIILFGILLPIVDSVTDLRMIIILYWGIPGCKDVNKSNGKNYSVSAILPSMQNLLNKERKNQKLLFNKTQYFRLRLV